MSPTPVITWQLAPDPEAYGEKAGWYILTTPDGEQELAGPWATVEEAHQHAREQGWVVQPRTTEDDLPYCGDCDRRMVEITEPDGVRVGCPACEYADGVPGPPR